MVAKTTPVSLSGSSTAQLSGKSPVAGRLGYRSDGDNSILLGNGTTTPHEYPTKTTVATLITNALSGISTYTHPATHAPSIISQDASNRFVTDAEKATWNAKAPLLSPVFTGTPTAPTAAANTNTTQIATTAFVHKASFVALWSGSVLLTSGGATYTLTQSIDDFAYIGLVGAYSTAFAGIMTIVKVSTLSSTVAIKVPAIWNGNNGDDDVSITKISTTAIKIDPVGVGGLDNRMYEIVGIKQTHG